MSQRVVTAFLILLSFFLELTDPTTSFVRSHVVPAKSKAVAVSAMAESQGAVGVTTNPADASPLLAQGQEAGSQADPGHLVVPHYAAQVAFVIDIASSYFERWSIPPMVSLQGITLHSIFYPPELA